MPLVDRPNCSSTSDHSTRVQPWPPNSGECRPPLSPAAIPACLRWAIVSAGRRPPSRSASSSRGISSSSTNLRARGAQLLLLRGELERQRQRYLGRLARKGHRPRPPRPPRPRLIKPDLRASWLSITAMVVSAAERISGSASSEEPAAARPRASTSQRSYARRRALTINRSNRLRSAAMRSGGAADPCLRVATASGSSRSGSGVNESHSLPIRTITRYRISAFDYKVKNTHPARPRPEALHGPERPGARARRAVPAHLAVRRPRRGPARRGQLPDGTGGRPAGAGSPRRRRGAARRFATSAVTAARSSSPGVAAARKRSVAATTAGPTTPPTGGCSAYRSIETMPSSTSPHSACTRCGSRRWRVSSS